VTTGERRAVVIAVRGRYEISERHACRALGFERSVMRLVPQRPWIDAPLRERLVALTAEHPRWGVPRRHWRLRRGGVLVNYQRVERLYRLEGLAVRRRERKRLAVPRPVAVGPNETWSLDFVSD
jgi:putative transposase